jgi:hypothetical protein
MILRAARLLALSTAVAAAVSSFAAPAKAEDDAEPAPSRARSLPPPPADLPPPSTRVNVALTGVGITAGFYGAAVATSFIWPNGAWAHDLRIPFAGPWMAMPDFKCVPNEAHCGTPLIVVRAVLAGLDGVGQAGGIFVALESLFLPVSKSSQARRSSAPQQAWVRPVPLVGKDTVGLGLVGAL